MIKLDNHRLLKAGEIIRKGDFYKDNTTGEIRPVKFAIGRTVRGEEGYRNYDFFRRKHTKKVAPVTRPKSDKPAPTVAVVTFAYPHEHRPVDRMVHVISLDDKYLTGLERTCLGYGKYKYQFKRFLISKMRTAIKLVYYGPNTK